MDVGDSTVVGVVKKTPFGVIWDHRDRGELIPEACFLGRSVWVLTINPLHLISTSSLWRLTGNKLEGWSLLNLG